MDTTKGSPERFAYSWAKFHDFTDEQRRTFERWTFLIESWNGKRILDVGCGGGRNTHWALQLGAASAVGIEADEGTVALARRNLGDRAEIRWQSVYDLPDRDAFDIVFSVGVVHHLERPELALERMTAAAKPGGLVHMWVYGREGIGPLLRIFDPLRRHIFSRLPLPACRALAIVPTAGLWVWLRLGNPQLEYWKLQRTFSFGYLWHLVFDQMLPKIANYWRRDECLALMRGAGLEDVRVENVNDVSWCCVGRKPHRNAK